MQTLINIIEDAAEFSGNSKRRIKVVLDKRISYEISYEELVKKARRVALTLQQKGIKKGDKIIYQIINPYHFIQMYWGCIYAGIIPVPITTPMNRSKKSEAYIKSINVYEQLGQPLMVVQERLYDIYKDLNSNESDNSVLIVEDFLSELAEDRNGIIEEVTENDIAFIQFSSGSTGFPKGVVLRHKNLVANIQQINERIEVTPDDRICNWMPLTHDMGLIGFHLTTIFAKGNQDIMMPNFFIRYTTEFVQYISDNKISIIGSPNFGIEWMLKRVSEDKLKDDSLKCLRGIFDGAEPIECKATKKFLARFGKYGLQDTAIYSSYGLAEACVAIAISDIRESFKTIILDWEKFTSTQEISILKDSEEEKREIEFAVIGKPLNGVDIKIIGDSEEEFGDNQVGEICVNGKNITEGYFDHPFNNEYFTQDGYLKTGDLGFIHKGELVVSGRKKDIIFINGMNIYSHDIEQFVLAQYQEIIKGAAVIQAYDDKKDKQVLVAFVKVNGNKNKEKISLDQMNKKMISERGIIFDYIVFIKVIPKTTSGKIMHYALQRDFEKGVYDYE